MCVISAVGSGNPGILGRPSDIATGASLRRAAVVPAEHPQRAERVPAARAPVAVLHLERDRALPGVLEEPRAVGLLLRPDQVDGLVQPRVRRVAGGAEVVQPAEDVEVPAGRMENWRNAGSMTSPVD